MLTKEIENYIMGKFGLNLKESYKLTQLSDGFSDAEVYILEISKARRSRDNGTFVLKVINVSENELGRNEAERTKEIYEKSIKFRKHLVKIKFEDIIENKLIIVLSFALEGKFNSLSLAQLRLDNQFKFLKNISYDLLKTLNYELIEDTDTNTNEGSMIKNLCSNKLEMDGKFVCRIKKYVKDIEYPAINIRGKVFPNPYYYIISSSILTDKIKENNVRFIKGFNHGDLHQKNIMISRDYEDYAIIDYDSYEKNFLLFDQAYLELNSYMIHSKEWDFEKWMEALRYTFRTSTVRDENVEFSGIIHIENCIREGIQQWYKEERPECMDDFKIQLQLARIAAGINYFSKRGIKEEKFHIKYLAYICYGLKELFSLITYEWDNSKATWLKSKEKDSYNVDALWNECGKLRNEYIKILITDDRYTDEKYKKLSVIGEIDWRLIVDVGEKKRPDDLMNTIAPVIQRYNGINYMTDDKNSFNATGKNTSIVQIKKGKGITEFEHWKKFKACFKTIFSIICAKEPLKPIIMITDINGPSLIRRRLIEMLLEDDMIRKGSHFICFGTGHELPLEDVELTNRKLKYYQHEDMDLTDIVKMIEEYGLHRKNIDAEIYLPCIESLDGHVTEEVYNGYKDIVELIYPGLDKRLTNYTQGVDFYKGNEISWEDIVQKRDIEWKQYNQWKKTLLKKLQNERISECKLLHGAGAGGTTLSKRLMWDLKDLYPSLRVKKYTSETANIIIDIYRKTGRCVFVVLEMGSTIISEDEYESVKRKVNAQSCHALFLKVERSISNDENAEICLSEDLKQEDAYNFFNKYLTMTSDEKRIECLEGITYNYTKDEWRGQCCPFFYGFYTFQEEYIGLGRFLKASIEKCNEKVKSILADLSLMTVYSQNICMTYEEMSIRFELEDPNLVELYEKFDESIGKILAQKENGFRICHPLIAKKLIELLYGEYNSYESKLYYATIYFIERMNEIYGEIGREYLDKIFKEMFIDRSYIDGEHQKFALLINDLEKQSDKIKVFDKLISLYPDNPHYYNHLGRLEIYDEQNLQFDKAIANLNRALTIAKEKKYNIVPHLTTLGCIYSKKVISDLNGYERNVKQLLDTILVDFGNASDCFRKARILKENSSYAYFPNILMICNVVKKITQVTGSNLETLLKDPEFEKWYNCYSGTALQLLEQMKRNCEEELSNDLKRNAENDILYLKGNVDTLKAKLITQKNKGIGIREQSNLRRTVTMLLYMQNEFRWEGMKKENLDFAVKELEEILESGEYNQYDVIAWFNIYRQMEEFESAKAKRYILDYMEDGYYKNYLLWILSFWEYEKGEITYKQVEEYLKECKYSSQLTENNIRSTRNIDVYSLEPKGFPIKKFSGIKSENEKYFKTFKGTIVDIDGTVKGKIQLDELDDINITFVPSFTVDDQKKEFKREDIGTHVEFKLIFTYSGYKAWNPRKCLV